MNMYMYMYLDSMRSASTFSLPSMRCYLRSDGFRFRWLRARTKCSCQGRWLRGLGLGWMNDASSWLVSWLCPRRKRMRDWLYILLCSWLHTNRIWVAISTNRRSRIRTRTTWNQERDVERGPEREGEREGERERERERERESEWVRGRERCHTPTKSRFKTAHQLL